MVLMEGVGMADQAYPVVGVLEGPRLSVVPPPVFAHDPVFGLVRVPVDSPAPEHRIEGVVQLLEHPSALDVRIIATPTTNQWVEGFDQRLLIRVFVAGD